MALDFSSSEYGSRTAGIPSLTSAGVTMALWVWTDAAGSFASLFGAGQIGHSTPVMLIGHDNNSPPQYFINSRDDSSNQNVVTDSVGASTGAWHHIAARISQDACEIFTDGGSGGTDSSATLGTMTLDRVTVGATPADLGSIHNGKKAEVAIWERLLADDEIVALAKGWSPLFFRDELHSYLPLFDTTGEDWRNGANLTLAGTPTKYPHPPMIYPGTVFPSYTPAAVAAANPKGPLGMPLHGPFGGPI